MRNELVIEELSLKLLGNFYNLKQGDGQLNTNLTPYSNNKIATINVWVSKNVSKSLKNQNIRKTISFLA